MSNQFRQPEQALKELRFRLSIAGAMVLVLFGILIGRLVWLQIVHYSKFTAQAENNRITIVPLVPTRGIILDRNQTVLVDNYSAYTLEITPTKIKNLDETLEQLSKIVKITTLDKNRFKKLRYESKRFESIPIRTRLNDEEVARFAVQAYKFPGVEIRVRPFRNYPYLEYAAHALGYIGRISERDEQEIKESNEANNYRGTTYIGKYGLEKMYEYELHGITGFEEVETSAGGKAVRVLSRHPSTPGNNLILSLDMKLQIAAERALDNRRGALVALDPNNGNILAMVSHPSFDPNLFVEGIDSENWKILNESPDRPLLNRPIAGTYPPGSTFKPFMAMAALDQGFRHINYRMFDIGHFDFGKRRFMDDKEGGHGTVDITKSIVESCNTFYYQLGNDMGIDAISSYLENFGFGALTGVDLLGERTGVLPSRKWKQNAFKTPETKRWYPGETISIAIGQGYNNYTPLQMAHAIGVLVSGGVNATPRLVSGKQNAATGEIEYLEPKNIKKFPFEQQYVDLIKKAMFQVTQSGTSRFAFQGASYPSGGKTGTAQVFGLKQGEKYKSEAIDERLKDHSWYIAFSPIDNPKIAMAVIVENGGFGSQAAAPVARVVLDTFWETEVGLMGPPLPYFLERKRKNIFETKLTQP